MNKLIRLSLLFWLTVGIFCGHLAYAADLPNTRQLFDQASVDYHAGKYDAAIEGYNQLLASGVESANLYYNLANSYVKKGELGKAVLNYERARILAPGDSDLKANYEYVLSTLNAGPRTFGSPFERFCQRLFEGVTVDFLVILLSAIYVLVIAGLILYLFQPTSRLYVRLAFIALSIISFFAVVAFYQKSAYLATGAVVVAKEAAAKFEPLDTATTYFKLSEGSAIEVLEHSGAWCKIKRPDGKLGWAKAETLETILHK